MRRLFYIIGFFILLPPVFFAQEKMNIPHIPFEFRIVTNDILSSEVVDVFRDNKKIHSHTLSLFDGDCSSEFIELGTYEVTGNTVTFYSYWASADRMRSPLLIFGARKQVYGITPAGELELKKAEIYLEDSMAAWEIDKTLSFLHTSKHNKEEKNKLKAYITIIEREYQATFTLENKEHLLKEVRNKLKDKISEATRNWDDFYHGNIKM